MIRKHSLSLFTLALAGILGWSLTLSQEPDFQVCLFAWAAVVLGIFLVHRDIGGVMIYGTFCGFVWGQVTMRIKFRDLGTEMVRMEMGTSLGLVVGFLYYKVLAKNQPTNAPTGTTNPPGASA